MRHILTIQLTWNYGKVECLCLISNDDYTATPRRACDSDLHCVSVVTTAPYIDKSPRRRASLFQLKLITTPCYPHSRPLARTQMNSNDNETVATCDWCWRPGMVRPTRQFTTLRLRHRPPDANFVHPSTSVRPFVGRLKSTFPIWFKRIQSIAKIFTSCAIRAVCIHIYVRCGMRSSSLTEHCS